MLLGASAQPCRCSRFESWQDLVLQSHPQRLSSRFEHYCLMDQFGSALHIEFSSTQWSEFSNLLVFVTCTTKYKSALRSECVVHCKKTKVNNLQLIISASFVHSFLIINWKVHHLKTDLQLLKVAPVIKIKKVQLERSVKIVNINKFTLKKSLFILWFTMCRMN